jgi:hypothetical protein
LIEAVRETIRELDAGVKNPWATVEDVITHLAPVADHLRDPQALEVFVESTGGRVRMGQWAGRMWLGLKRR